MKKKSFITAALLIFGLTACQNEPTFKVEGTISGAADKTLYIEHSGIDRIEAIDSVTMDAKGTFNFSVKSMLSPEFYRLRIDNRIINFSVDSTETVQISANYDKFATAYTIKGSENNNKIKELVLLQSKLQADVRDLGNAGLPAGLAQEKLVQLIDNYKKEVKINYIFKNPQTTYAYFALFQQLNGMMIFNPLTNKDDVKCFAAVATSLNNDYPHAERSRNLYNMVIKGMKNTRTVQPQEFEIPEEKIKETTIIDIPLRDLKGQEHHLTDLKGKVVLLEFTAYASPESGARILALREIYKKYADKGLEIYQISLDPDEHFWKTASDNLPWICVRDPRAQYSNYARLYGVTQLPSAFIVSRDNVVSLRMDEKTDLEEAIKKFL